jgi:multiple sugar transport system ATP-binding protein
MNFMPATVEGNNVKLPFGTVEIPAEKAEKAAGKGLLIAGVRPEHFEDASVVRGDTSRDTFRANVDVVEWLGNEAYAYIPFEVEAELRAELDQLERELEGEGTRTQLVVSLDGASQIQEGDEAEIWVDARRMHLFDPATGENLTVDRARAGRIPNQEGSAQPATA